MRERSSLAQAGQPEVRRHCCCWSCCYLELPVLLPLWLLGVVGLLAQPGQQHHSARHARWACTLDESTGSRIGPWLVQGLPTDWVLWPAQPSRPALDTLHAAPIDCSWLGGRAPTAGGRPQSAAMAASLLDWQRRRDELLPCLQRVVERCAIWNDELRKAVTALGGGTGFCANSRCCRPGICMDSKPRWRCAACKAVLYCRRVFLGVSMLSRSGRAGIE